MSQPDTESSNCDGLREINTAKYNSIITYLEDVSNSNNVPESPSVSNEAEQCVKNNESSCPKMQNIDAAPPALQSLLSTSNQKTSFNPLNIGVSNGVYMSIKRKINYLQEQNEELLGKNSQLRQQLQSFEKKEAEKIKNIQDLAMKEIQYLGKEQREAKINSNKTISKLLERNKELTEKCTKITDDMKEIAAKRESDLRRLEDGHIAALNNMKAKWRSNEIKEREQWMLKKAREIKETTLRAMEPDIKMLMDRHRMEITRINDEYELQLKQKERQLDEKDSVIIKLKSQVSTDSERLLVKEREEFRVRLDEETKRLHRVIDTERENFEERQRAQEKAFESQKDSYVATIKSLEEKNMDLRKNIADQTANFHITVANEVSKQLSLQETELAIRRCQLDKEILSIQGRLEKENKRILKTKESELRTAMLEERDTLIKKAVQSLKAEYAAETARVQEGRKEIEEKILQLDRQLAAVMSDKNVIEQQLQTTLVQNKDLTTTIKDLHAQLKIYRDNHDNIRGMAQVEFEQRLHLLDSVWQTKLRKAETDHVEEVEILTHKLEIKEKASKRRCDELQEEIKTLEARHSAELSSINDKLVASLAKKDACIEMLQEQLKVAHMCIEEREVELNRHMDLVK